MNERSIAVQLHDTIAEWYVSLRNLVIVGLMLILVYVGIRMVISSTASDKAKYKQMLVDWLIALCIVFCLHYIMTFTTTIVSEISMAISGGNAGGNNIAVTVYTDEAHTDIDTQFNTDLMGLMRFRMQTGTGGNKLLYLILYGAMVIYTCLFTFYYLKRVLTMAFLTIISPLVALTYPIDKMGDGKSQAFNMWLKEYIFNALIQPFHLIIYTVFVGTAMDLAVTNPLIAIVALAFLTPAEKILRKFFGFEKAGTAGSLGSLVSVAGGAAAMNAAKNLMSPKKGGSGGKTGDKVRTKDNLQQETPSMVSAGESSGDSSDNTSTVNNRDNNIPRNNAEGLDYAMEQSMVGDWDDGQPSTASNTSASTTPDSGTAAVGGGSTSGSAGETVGGNTSGGSLDGSANGANGETQKPHLEGSSLEYTDNDDRGMGQWLKDGITNSAMGVRVGKVYRGAKGKAQNMAEKVKSSERYNKAKKEFNKKTPIRNTIRNSVRTLGNTAKGVGNVAWQTTKSVAKAGAKALPGAAFGMMAGIAGDELNDIAKYTTAGAALSSTIGSSAVAQAGRFVSNAYNQGAHGSVEGQLEQKRKELMKDENNKLLAKQQYPDASKGEIREATRKAVDFQLMGASAKDSFKAVKAQDALQKKLAEQGMPEDNAEDKAHLVMANALKELNGIEKKDLMNKGKVESYRENYTNKFRDAGLSGKELTSTVDMLISGMKTIKGVKNDY